MTTRSAEGLPAGVRFGVGGPSPADGVRAGEALDAFLAGAHAAGFEGVELGRTFPRDPAALEQRLAGGGLALASVWREGSLAEASVAEEWQAVASHAGVLRALGATVVVLSETARLATRSERRAPGPAHLVLPRDEAAAHARRLTEFAKRLRGEAGLALAYRPGPMLAADTFDDASRMIDRTGPEVGLLLDVALDAPGAGHATLIERFGDRVAHIRIAWPDGDTDPEARDRARVSGAGGRDGRPGVTGAGGALDPEPLVRFVRAAGYRGWIVAAEEPDAKAPPTDEALAAAFREVAGLFGVEPAQGPHGR